MPTYRGGTIINIAGLTPVDDPEYRYKMPAVYGKIEGSGNGIKTAIPNISDVASSLHRSPGEVNKFFGTELGAQSRYNADTDRAIVNGEHTDAKLQELVHRYVEKFVLCPNCGLPETEYKIKRGTIYHRCAACGATEMVDMEHKLVNYILAEAKKDKATGSASAAKKDGKKDDKKKSKKKEKDGGSDNEEKKKKEKKDKKKASSSSSSKKKDKSEGTCSPITAGFRNGKVAPLQEQKFPGLVAVFDHWSAFFLTSRAFFLGSNGGEDGGGDYIKDALLGKSSNGAFHDGNDEGGDDDSSDASEAGVDDAGARVLAVEAAKAFLASNPSASASELVEFITNQQMASALKSHERIYIAIRAIFTTSFKDGEVAKYAPIISKITNGKRIMERHLIASLEAHCADKPKYFPVFIKQLYDEDALEEETILEWADEGRSDYTLEEVDEETRAVLRSEAEPVVVWLQEADSDSDDDDDDGDDDE
jgi:translation initiation factor 5